MATENMSDPSTPLQQELVQRILALVHEQGLRPGDRLKEARLAELLGVSRTPVRAAMEILHHNGIVQRQPNRGMVLVAVPPPPEAASPPPLSTLDQVLVDFTRLRHEALLGDHFTEAELLRRLPVERSALREALTRIEELGMIARKSGYGWSFTQAVRDSAAKTESYRFRLLIEPAAILEPAFKLDPEWIARMRAEHLAFLEREWADSTAIALFEMNARFHHGLCAASGNRYLAEAMARQNQLRRLHNYAWQLGRERVVVTCSEHIEILDRLVENDREMAALLMRRHLQGVSKIKSRPRED